MPGEEPVVLEQNSSQPESGVEGHQNNVEVEQEATLSTETAVNIGQELESSSANPLVVAEDSTVTDDLSSISDPSLIDIDKYLEGEVVLVTADSEEMAEAKHAKKNKKKSKDKLMDALQESLKSLPPDEQIAIVLEKYSELVENNRLLQGSVKQIQKQVENVQRERENMEAEHSKIVLSKSRLESLCRELQRQNKLIKDENVSRLKEEEERRKEVASKFNSTLSEISNLMKENSDKNNKLRDENQDMAGRLQDLVKQYEARETHVEKILKAKDLQCQLAEAKLAKQHIELTENKEKMLLEKKSLLEDISAYQEKLQTMSETEISLRTQLNSYMEKYEEFQSTLDKSNKIFNTFKKEMDEMTKKIKRLEKETKTWKERWEGANKALLDMVSERSDLEKKIELQGRQNVQLQNLCRALQEQVTELRKQNKISSDSEIQADILNEVMATKEASTETVPEKKNTKEESVQITPDCPTPEEESIPALIEVDTDSEVSKDVIETISPKNSLEAPTGDTAGISTSNTEGASENGLNYLDVD